MTANSAGREATIPAEAIEAVAQKLYGEQAYEALGEGQIKNAYRARARRLLQVAREATEG